MFLLLLFLVTLLPYLLITLIYIMLVLKGVGSRATLEFKANIANVACAVISSELKMGKYYTYPFVARWCSDARELLPQ